MSEKLALLLEREFSNRLHELKVQHGEITMTLHAGDLHEVCMTLRDDPDFCFEQLMDVCGVDYLHYGLGEWATESTTLTGFGRARDNLNTLMDASRYKGPRFASVYHLLSIKHNWRLRLRVFLEGEIPKVDSVTDVWASANWFEREAYDLFGIVYENHPDLRRILTDYGFVGHPFRKDFPLIGNVEMRYDAKEQRCVYEPVSIQPRTTVARVVRDDNRYKQTAESEGE